MLIRTAVALLTSLSCLTAGAARGDELMFGERPAWSSGSERSGGDGDGDLDLAAGCLAQAMVFLNETQP